MSIARDRIESDDLLFDPQFANPRRKRNEGGGGFTEDISISVAAADANLPVTTTAVIGLHVKNRS